MLVIDLLHQLTNRLCLGYRTRQLTVDRQSKKRLPIRPTLGTYRQHFAPFLNLNRSAFAQHLHQPASKGVQLERPPHDVIGEIVQHHVPGLHLVIVFQGRNQITLLRRPIIHLRQIGKHPCIPKGLFPASRFPDRVPRSHEFLERSLHSLLTFPKSRLTKGMIEFLPVTKAIP